MKERIKIVVAFILGVILTGTTVYAATIISSINVGYSNEDSKLVADNVQDAIDEVYKKASESKAPQPKNENIKAMYYYDENKESEDFCVTGDEKTCKVNTCYLNNTEGSCSPGTIVEYMVNEQEKIRFHVMHDDGEKLTLQSQKNTIYNIVWYSTGDEVVENSDSSNPICKNCDNTKGPLTILESLENATSNWSNVNDLNYSIGIKDSTLGYSECNSYDTCNATSYTLSKNNKKARMITIQEAANLNCTTSGIKKCPIWMFNYLHNSILNGGTVNDVHTENNGDTNYAYWLMNSPHHNDRAWYIMYYGALGYDIMVKKNKGARAVVEITKS